MKKCKSNLILLKTSENERKNKILKCEKLIESCAFEVLIEKA